MDTITHFEKLRQQLNAVFDTTLTDLSVSGNSQYYAACLYEFSEHIQDASEKRILERVCSQIQGASLTAAFGLYRQAFSSLRLSLEMGLSTAYFSIHRLEMYEWLDGREDIHWNRLIDKDRGVLSDRFAQAFFPDLLDEMKNIRVEAIEVYRSLSEFVHGNNETWEDGKILLKYNKIMYNKFNILCRKVFEILMFVLMCRYMKTFNAETLDELVFISAEFSHMGPIREFIGGPKDI